MSHKISKILKVLALVFLVSLFLVGCSTTTPTPNPEPTPNPTPNPDPNPNPSPSQLGAKIYKPGDLTNGKISITLSGLQSDEKVAVIPVQANQRPHEKSQSAPKMPYTIQASGIEGVVQEPSKEQDLVHSHGGHTHSHRHSHHHLNATTSLGPQQQSVFGDVCAGPYPVGKTCEFTVLDGKVSTELKKVTENAFWFFDPTYINSENYTDAEIDKLANIFETEVMSTITKYHGDFADVDNNGKVILVFANLGADTFGYVSSGDYLDSDSVQGGSNEADIFYANVPSIMIDDNLSYRAFLDQQMPSTLVHELMHLVVQGSRLGPDDRYDGQAQSRGEMAWLEEGMAVSSEELSKFNSALTSGAQNTGGNIALGDPSSYRMAFLDSPGETKIPEEREATNYGYSFLFLWPIATKIGHEIFWKQLIQNKERGIDNLEKVSSGKMEDHMTDFALRLMFDHTNVDIGGANYDYVGVNLRDGTWANLKYNPLEATISSETYSVAYYVGQGTGADATLELSSTDKDAHFAVVRFKGDLGY